MNSHQTQPLDIVHEAIDERQHVRTRLPATAQLSIKGQSRPCEIIDISLGGMSLAIKGGRPEESDTADLVVPGMTTNATILLNLQHFELNIAASVKVVAVDGEMVRVAFVEIDRKKMDTLRYVISSYISGDVVNIDGVFNLVQRENYIKERKVKADTSRSFFDRFKAIFGSLIYLAIGLSIFALIAYKLFLYFFQVQAVSGVVEGSPYVVSMPENGYVKFLVDKPQNAQDFVQVQTGQPIAAVSSQLMTSFNTPDDVLALTEISQQDLQTLYGKAFIETVINSPCDCNIFFTDSVMDRYAYKEQPLMHMLPLGRQLIVRASFPYDKIDDLKDVESVRLRLFGESVETGGRIVRSRINNETGMLDVIIEPEQAITVDNYLKPVGVRVLTGASIFDWAKGTFQ
jgi:alginate biosynthesis protein Alg44